MGMARKRFLCAVATKEMLRLGELARALTPLDALHAKNGVASSPTPLCHLLFSSKAPNPLWGQFQN